MSAPSPIRHPTQTALAACCQQNTASQSSHRSFAQDTHTSKPQQDPSLTLARGARQLVVQDALDTTLWLLGSYLSWLTPITNMGASAEGAEITTFLAPAFMWGWHCGREEQGTCK